MSILIYTESENGRFKKSSLELASYGRALADKFGLELTAISFNQNDSKRLGNYGVDRLIKIIEPSLENFNAQHYAANLTSVALENSVKLILMSSSANAKYLAPLLAVSLSAGYASNVVEPPISLNPLTVRRSCFTNKAFNTCVLNSEVNIIGLSNNSFGISENPKEIIVVDKSDIPLESNLVVEKVEKTNGQDPRRGLNRPAQGLAGGGCCCGSCSTGG